MQLLQEEQLLTRYLLGELQAEEEKGFEDRLCLDGDLFERMLAYGDDLIDDYLGARLSVLQRRSFEQHFLALPERRERLEMARALQNVFAVEREAQAALVERKAEQDNDARVEPELVPRLQWLRDLRRGRPLAFALTAVAALLLLTGPLSIIYSLRLRDELKQAHAEREASERRLQQEIAQERERADRAELKLAQRPPETPDVNPRQTPLPKSDLVASIALSSDYISGDRGPQGAGGGKLAVPPGEGRVQLQLQLRSDDFGSYRVTIRASSSERQVWRQADLRARTAGDGKAVVVTLPAGKFGRAGKNYLITLDGRTAEGKYEKGVDRYSFQVERK